MGKNNELTPEQVYWHIIHLENPELSRSSRTEYFQIKRYEWEERVFKFGKEDPRIGETYKAFSEEDVHRYAEMQQSGSDFPAFVALANGTDDKLFLLDGKHRIEASIILGVEITGFIGTVPDEVEAFKNSINYG